MILNIYGLNVSASNFTQQILVNIKGQIGPDTIILSYLKLPVSSIDSPCIQNQGRYLRIKHYY
jgi:hypothetical protein